MSNLVHLHNHTEYSLLDGMTTPEEAMEIAASHGQRAIAITDHGTCGGYMRFQSAGDKYGVKPIFGVEAYFTEDIVEDKADKKAERFHMILLAKNDEGLKNIFRLQKRAWVDGFYYKPRLDWNMLEGNGNGIIATTSCMGGIVARCIRDGDFDRADAIVSRMEKVFDSLFVELQPHNDPALNAALLTIARGKNLPIVGTIDCHYPTENHKELEEVLLCVGQFPSFNTPTINRLREVYKDAKKKPSILSKLDFLYPDRRLRFAEHDHWIMGEDEFRAAFAKAHFSDDLIQEMIDNSNEIAESCNAKIKTGQALLPKYSSRYNSNEYLIDIAEFKMQEMGLTSEVYRERLAEELNVITNLNFSDYFLIIWDLVNWAKTNNILVGAGRGSAAGSLLSYVLGITDVDPIEHNLIFWRFINPDRIDYPDIDLDFEDRRRAEVKQYLKERWGIDNVAAISTYGEFKPKSVVKDVARIFGVPASELNVLTQHFDSIEEFLFSAKTQAFRTEWPDVGDSAKVLHNRIRQAGAGAAGMIVANTRLDDIIPLETRNDPNSDEDDRIIVSAYDLDDCQKVGLIKLDILGINTLSVVHDALDVIKERHGVDVAAQSQTLDDPNIFAEFSAARTMGVFQTESTAYKNLLLRMGIDNFTDLAASNALVRPGAMISQTGTYIDRKHGREEIVYDHPLLEPITKDTYGTFVYQEQIMETVVVLAGFNWREADTLRKIMGKKKDESEWEEWRQKFIDGATQHISEKRAEKMWEDFVHFSGYAFNKSHAISYSKLSYQTMWLKYYYTTEFMWALLKNEGDKQARATYLMEATRLGIKILPPDINKSDVSFSLEGDAIRFGLSNVSGVGPSALKEILSKRPFGSFEEFRGKCKTGIVKAGAVEPLIKVGAFDGVGYHNPYEANKYYYSVLNYPIDIERKTKFDSKVTPCSEWANDEKRLGIVKGIVRDTKRTATYFRVEIEDMSGSVTIFANKDYEISKGEFLVALIGNKTLHAYLDVYKLEEAQDNPFYAFLMDDPIEKYEEAKSYMTAGKSMLAHIINVRKFKTKTGKSMASMLVWDGTTYADFIVFPKEYANYAMDLQPWKTVVVRPQLLEDGGLTIEKNGMMEVEAFLTMMRKKKAATG